MQDSTLPSAIDTTGTLILRPPGRCMRPLGFELSRSPSPIRMIPQLGAAESVKSSAVSRVEFLPNACVLHHAACKIASGSHMQLCTASGACAYQLAASPSR